MSDQYEAVIGLEVHCQLATETKAFSADSAVFASEPNSHLDPLTIGHPGTLPVYNERAVDFALKMGLATESEINGTSVFARKHYFYPDLPKGYQISQFDRPICSGGFVRIDADDADAAPRDIRLTRIHVEEDAGKSIHSANPDSTLLDFNRSGVALIEIVSEPELRSPQEAYRFMRKIRQLVRYLEISDGNMDEGSLRCDANVSMRPAGTTALGQKTEIKNMNSFRFLEKALTFEIYRQTELLLKGETIVSETRLWDSEKGETGSMRSKEESHDYRYFPDPDLLPIRITDELLERVRTDLPVLPDVRIERYTSEWGLPVYDAVVLTNERGVADYFEDCISKLDGLEESNVFSNAKTVSNFLMTHVLRDLEKSEKGEILFQVDAGRLAGLLTLRIQEQISSSAAVAIYEQMLKSETSASEIAEALNLYQAQDVDAIDDIISTVLEEHPDSVEAFRGGKTGLIGFFIGQVMSRYPGSPDPKMVRSQLESRLNQDD